MKKIKMIGLDLDGTLLNSKKEVTDHTKSVLEEAIAQGIIVLVATGRPLTGIPGQVRAIQGMQYALTTNGARIYDLIHEKTILSHPVPYEKGKKALEITEKYDTLQEAYFDREVYAQENQLQEIWRYHKNPHMWEYVRSTRTVVPSIVKWYGEAKRDADKLQLMFADMQDIERARKELEEIPGLVLTGSLGNNIEINAQGIDKGIGMLELGHRLGIDRDEIMACGDGDNDLEMLKAVGFGVAMGNAEESVKAVADYVTDTNEEEGVAKAVEKFAVEGITEWLPISSTGHLILVEEFVKLNFSQSYLDMFNVVIQLGAIMAVVVIYFHRLNPFSPKKTEKQKRMTLQLWVKVVIASIPAGVVGVLFNDFIEEKFNNSYVVATMLIVVGVLFIVIENRHKGRKPQITKISQMGVPVLIWIGVFQMLAMIPGTSRSGATIVGALALGVSRTAAADFTFFLAIPAMAGASLVKLRHFGFDFTGTELGLLLLGCVVSFVVSILAIKFLLKYIQNHDFKAFGYYRIVLGIIVFLYFGIHALLA